MWKGSSGEKSMKIEYMPIEELKPYANNAKVHTAEQIEQIKQSIQEFGFNDPIAIWRNNEIIEGHGRLIAASEMGLEKVPVIRLDGLTDQQRKAYILIHNKLTMDTGFNFDLLMDELDNLSIDMAKYGFDLDEEDSDYEIENTEYDAEEFNDEKFEYECPECGFKFNA